MPPFRRGKPRTGSHKHCKHCGKLVYVRAHRNQTFQYCSTKCKWDWEVINQQIPVDCKVCGKTFTVIACRRETAKYCSRACYYRAMQRVGSIELQCVVCGKSFQRPPSRAIYANPVCDKNCRGLLMRTSAPSSAAQARKWLERRGSFKACSRCGYDAHPEILVVHHRDYDRRNNSANNFEVLCPNCHAIEHYVKASV
jgi:hypothetical protein